MTRPRHPRGGLGSEAATVCAKTGSCAANGSLLASSSGRRPRRSAATPSPTGSPRRRRLSFYAKTAHYTVALDGASCRVVWQSEWKPRDRETFITQRGTAMKDGKVVRGTGDGYLLALDGKTGKELWSRQVAKPGEG
jgi:outer membrane protein assembly factor BamB